MNDLPAANGVAHFGECRRILRGVRSQYNQVAVHPVRDAPAARCVAEAFGRIRGQGGKDLLKTHPRAQHQLEFFGSVELVDVANICAEEDLSTALTENSQLVV